MIGLSNHNANNSMGCRNEASCASNMYESCLKAFTAALPCWIPRRLVTSSACKVPNQIVRLRQDNLARTVATSETPDKESTHRVVFREWIVAKREDPFMQLQQTELRMTFVFCSQLVRPSMPRSFQFAQQARSWIQHLNGPGHWQEEFFH